MTTDPSRAIEKLSMSDTTDKPSPALPPPSAAARVFVIAELVEAILLNLNVREVFAVARVNAITYGTLACRNMQRKLGVVHTQDIKDANLPKGLRFRTDFQP